MLQGTVHSAQCTVQRAHNWALHLLDCSIMSSKLDEYNSVKPIAQKVPVDEVQLQKGPKKVLL